MNLPNKLTIARIILVPVFWVFLTVAAPWAQLVAFFVFLIASATDYVDGYIARSRNLVTDFGKFVDPIADKLLVTTGMLVLLGQGRMADWVVILFIAREFIIAAFRMVAAGKGVVIAADKLGKYKTVTQMIAVVMSILCLGFGGVPAVLGWPPFAVLARAMMWAALALAVLSCVDYILLNRSVIDTTNI